ncbi:MAG TPA: Na+/H+ antiporter [Candidatus Limnocylindria bacterium]|jgi:CPA1 family monovalent cation:H+ antiporter
MQPLLAGIEPIDIKPVDIAVAVELVLALLVLVALLTVAARRIGVPYPILMTLGGLALGLLPGLPRVGLAPDLVFLLFLPPLLFSAAFFTSPRDLQTFARPIGLLAIGLVLTTTLIVGVIVHTLAPAIPWAIAFLLGAVVSPPDAVAATSIAQRLGLPRRVVIILEGESLVNDATALVAYRLALVAAVSGTFSLGDAAISFVVVSLGGVVIGLIAGRVIVAVLGRVHDPPVEVLLSLLAPFGCWLLAEALGVSGVLSVVTAGIVVGRHISRITSSDTRVLASGVWQMVVFTLTGVVFILIGLQLPTILDTLSASRSFGELASWAVVVAVTVILVRLASVFPSTYLPRLLSARIREREPAPALRNVVIVGWAGMRGVVSLAAALALPLYVKGGAPFPERDLVIFLTFAVILATLVGQGLTLPFLIRWLGVGDDGSEAHEELHAREAAALAALSRLDELANEWPGHLELVDHLRDRQQHATEHLEHDHESGEVPQDQEAIEHAIIQRAVIDAQRLAVIDLRDRGVISDEAVRVVERSLDLEELRAEG